MACLLFLRREAGKYKKCKYGEQYVWFHGKGADEGIAQYLVNCKYNADNLG